jgi:hypothetical protein
MINVSCTEARMLQDIIEKQLRLVCFGTGVMAREALERHEIAGAVVAFADNDPGKQGKQFSPDGRLPCPIINPADIPRYIYITNTTAILIASAHFKQIREQLERIAGLEKVPCYIYPLVRFNMPADSGEYYEKRLVQEAIKEYRTVLAARGTAEEEIVRLTTEKAVFMRGAGKDGAHPVVIPRIMIMPSTRCNMRCKGCSSLFPYFEHPADIGIEQLKNDINVFFGVIDECIRLTIGGEPFLYPKLKELLEFLIWIPNLSGIYLVTNSTILPKDELFPLLQNPKVYIQISDYGHIEKMSRLASLFEAKGVHFDVLSEQTWTDMGDTHFRNKDAETLRYEYLNCEQGRVIKAIFNGRLYICARSARMHALGAYSSDHDCVELSGTDTREETLAKLCRIYYTEYADACNYCDLGKFPAKHIPAGVQMGGNFRSSSYTLVKREEYNRLKKLAELR